MTVNGLTIMTWALCAAIGVLVAWHYSEKHFKHELQQIKLINTAHIEESMRADGWLVDQMDAFDRDLFDDDVFDQEKWDHR